MIVSEVVNFRIPYILEQELISFLDGQTPSSSKENTTRTQLARWTSVELVAFVYMQCAFLIAHTLAGIF